MNEPFDKFRDIEPMSTQKIIRAANAGDVVALNHWLDHEPANADPDCPHCYHAGWLAHLEQERK